MEEIQTDYGKVAITLNGKFNKKIGYDELCLVYDDGTKSSYISKKKVPNNTEITNEEYWQVIAKNVNGIKLNTIVKGASVFYDYFPDYKLVNLGKIENKDIAENFAALSEIAGNANITFIVFTTTINNEINTGYITNSISSNKMVQQIYSLGTTTYVRHITGVTGIIGNPTNAFNWEITNPNKIKYDINNRKIIITDYSNHEISNISIDDFDESIYLDEFDNMCSTIDKVKKLLYSKKDYTVLDRFHKYNIGKLIVFSDDMRHVINQVFITNCTLDENGTFGHSHDHHKIFIYYRMYNLYENKNTWTKWTNYLDSSQNVMTINEDLNDNQNYLYKTDIFNITTDTTNEELKRIFTINNKFRIPKVGDKFEYIKNTDNEQIIQTGIVTNSNNNFKNSQNIRTIQLIVEDNIMKITIIDNNNNNYKVTSVIKKPF